ncbi:MAG: TolC family protein, partial [Clostridia bacterium]
QIKSLQLSIDGADSAIAQLNDSLSIVNALDAIDTRISQINQAEMDAAASGHPLPPEQIAANRATIAGLQQQQATIMRSVTQANSTKETLKSNVATLRYTKKSTIELMVYTAQNLISSYYKLQNQKDNAVLAIADTERQRGTIEALYSVGRATADDLRTIEYSIKSLENTSETLALQNTSLIRQFNLLLGRDSETKVDFSEFKPQIATNSAKKELKENDLTSEYELAAAACIDIQSQSATLKAQKSGTSEYRTEEAKLAELKRKFKAEFYNAFNDVFIKQSALSSCQDTLFQKSAAAATAKTKYDVGYISKNDFITAKNSVDNQKIAVTSAQIDYQNAVLKYNCFLNGGWPQA